MKEKNNTLVFDVGRTHIKAFLFQSNGNLLKEDIQNHKFIKKVNKLNIIEVEKIFILICNQIKNFSENFNIKKIIFTTHASVSIIHTNEKKDIYLPVLIKLKKNLVLLKTYYFILNILPGNFQVLKLVK